MTHSNAKPLGSLIRHLPKAELHLHLEGSLQPSTLRELTRHDGALRDQTEQWIRDREHTNFRYADFRDFLNAFKFVAMSLQTPRHYALATERLIEQLAEEGIVHAEITLSAGVILWKGQSVDAVFGAVAEAAAEAGARCGVSVLWIFDAVRQFGVEHVSAVLDCALLHREQGVVAFGIGGDEQRGPAEQFESVYDRARQEGLHCTAHAGETAGPESVNAAVERLGAERVGHGLAAARDANVMRLLRERGVPLEVCLSSNVCTGVISRPEEHPLPALLEAAVPITLNTDDPGLFGTTLNREMVLAARTFGLSADQIIGISESAIKASFLPGSRKDALLRKHRIAAERDRAGASPVK